MRKNASMTQHDNHHLNADLLLSVPLKEFLKSVSILMLLS